MKDEKKTEDQTEASAKTAKKATYHQPPSRWERFREYVGGSLFTNQAIAAFTLVLAAAAIYQFIIMNGQLRTMRQDERAWVKITWTPEGLHYTEGRPVQIPMHLINIGKTVAKKVAVKIIVEVVKNGESPVFMALGQDDTRAGNGFYTGIIYPGDSHDFPHHIPQRYASRPRT